MASTTTILQVSNWASTFAKLLPLVGVGGYANEPTLSIANDVLQEMMSAPYNWRFNRTSLPVFTLANNQQDYIVTGATATVATKGIVPINTSTNTTPGLTESGTTVTCTLTYAPPTAFAVNDSVTVAGAAVPGYNGTFTITAVPTATSFQYTAAGGLANSGGAGITDMNWAERCVLEDFASTSTIKPRHNIEVVATLFLESIVQPPFKVAFQSENLADNSVLIRFWPVPSSQIWTCYLDYQQKPPIKASLNDTWSPVPDELAYVYRQGFLAKALKYAEDQRAAMEFQQFQLYMNKALDIKDQEATSEAFFPERPIQFGG